MNTVLGASTYFLSAVALMFCFCGCGKTEKSFANALVRSAETALTTTNATVSVPLVTQFEWDTLFIFSPYTPVDRIHTQLGYKWEEAQRTHIDSSETFYLLVFTKDGKLVQHYKFPRTLGDFENLEGGNTFSKEAATFAVKRAANTAAKRLIFTRKRGD